jgi:hypothetical protein
MITTNTGWIDHLLALNRHIVAAEQSLSRQAGRIIDALEMHEDIADKEETFVSYRAHLQCLRQMRDAMLAGTRAVD